ncbi:hypothetical protein Y1Q_0001329 [Alligator mississippiensis]|uniref:Secreted protein n=1 Tax=Alligator mississippiensis TaxID=8496 RepID=A0A151M934_ALLMI|nr:hypothetical protein Y1Q_0001329 [Alligator mississippiensis]
MQDCAVLLLLPACTGLSFHWVRTGKPVLPASWTAREIKERASSPSTSTEELEASQPRRSKTSVCSIIAHIAKMHMPEHTPPP